MGFTLAESYQAALDAVFKEVSLTGRFETPSREVNFTGAATAKIRKMSSVGLGTYSRSSGWPAGDLTVTWETIQLSYERGRGLSLDAMDAEEAKTEVGEVAGEYLRSYVVPEVDAYRFNKWAGATGIQSVTVPVTLSKATILDAIGVAKRALNAKEVPLSGRVLFLSDSCYGFLEDAVGRTLANETVVDRRVTMLDGIEVIMVPQTRFYKGITLNPGATSNAGGFTKTTSTGRNINFMLAHRSAIGAVFKHAPMKIIKPEENQSIDGWGVKYRVYGEAWVFEEKVDGVYTHIDDE